MYPIVELEPMPNGSIKQTIFSDYRDVGGMPIPFEMISSVDTEQQSSIILDAASLNTGVLSKLFDIPESLLVE